MPGFPDEIDAEVLIPKPEGPQEQFERALHARGYRHVAGIDEVGRGALFGPVVAAAVVLDPGRQIKGLRDSKALTPRQRSKLCRQLIEYSADWGVGVASAREIDQINILRATRLAMCRAVRTLRRLPDHLLIDALRLDDLEMDQISLVRGDARCTSIAAASIVAKVTRDTLIDAYGQSIRGYGLRRNKGYATAEHRAAVMRYGRTELHRATFRVQGTLPFAQSRAGAGEQSA